MEIEHNENSSACAQCGGICCKRMGCHTHPDDIIRRFGPITRETLIKVLKCGEFSADCWDGDVREDNDIPYPEEDYRSACWFIRARHIGGKAIDKSYGGICINLTKHGCKFDWENRPAGGRGLVPNTEHPGKCSESTFDKVPGVLAWLPYSELIEEIAYSPEFDDDWTNSLDFLNLSLELREQGKTIEDLIPN